MMISNFVSYPTRVQTHRDGACCFGGLELSAFGSVGDFY